MAKAPRDPKAEAPPHAPARRSNRVRAVGEMVGEVGGVAFRKFGFAQSQLLGRWRDVMGPLYARWTAPEGLRMAKGGGTLTVRVDGPFAAQLQHAAPGIIERVNRVFGYAAVARLRLVQGEVDGRADPDPPRPVAFNEPAPPLPERAAGELRAIRDDAFRASLEDLARQVAATRGPPRIA